jgi:guanosine-3',5'-bis(diphosphate) 3'-pyrophosphohydrolase
MDQTFQRFVRALSFASRKHSQQRRKDADASPYVNHPIALVKILERDCFQAEAYPEFLR